MIDLTLHPRLLENATGLAYAGDLRHVARGVWFKKRAIGGYWTGALTLSQEQLSRPELVEFYNRNIGCRLVARQIGQVAYEAELYEMRLVQGAREWVISLNPAVWHNRVKVRYSDTVGSRQEADWSENTSSSDIFGESNLLDNIGGSSAAAAAALRDKLLTEGAWPRSRQVSGGAVEIGAPSSVAGEPSQSSPDVLTVTLAGYVTTLGRRYRETSETAAASTLLTTLVNESEFVTAGRIETNSVNSRIDAYPSGQRLSAFIVGNKGIVAQGDGSGNRWRGGVYAGRKFIYEPSPIDWEYQLSGDTLMNRGDQPVDLALVDPGFLLFNPDAPTGWARPGTTSGDLDDPRIAYVEELEFVAAEAGGYDELRMSYDGGLPGSEIIARRLSAGSAIT